eukprot:3512419-Karenia_brevis.AAC.1
MDFHSQNLDQTQSGHLDFNSQELMQTQFESSLCVPLPQPINSPEFFEMFDDDGDGSSVGTLKDFNSQELQSNASE